MTTVVAAVFAAVLAGVFALLGARQGATNQNKAWLRAQRLESATEFLAASDELLSRLIDTADATERWHLSVAGTDRLLDMPARSRLILVGNTDTEQLLRGLVQQLGTYSPEAPSDDSDSYRSARMAFVRHVRQLIHD